MKRIQSALFALLLLFGAQNALAGAGHYHGPVTEAQAGQIATNVVRNMAEQGNISASWGRAPLSNLARTSLGGNMMWQAEFANAEDPNPERRKLNVYLTLTGGFIKADYAAK